MGEPVGVWRFTVSDNGREIQPRVVGLPSGQPPPARTKSEEMTDLIDTLALESGEHMGAMALQALKDGMGGNDLKLRIAAAKAYLAEFHHPKQQMDVNVNETVTISEAARDATDKLTPEEKEIVAQFEKFLPQMRPDVIEDAEVVEEADD